jgi:diaminopimelate decarboxylase
MLAHAMIRAPVAMDFHLKSTRSRTSRRHRIATAARTDATAMERLNFLTPSEVASVRETFGTPTYVYDRAALVSQATAALGFPNAYGLTVRYAMKASPNAAILKTFHGLGLHIDASSGYECVRAMRAGFEASSISLSTQELPSFFDELIAKGVKMNACSLSQLRRYGECFRGGEIGLRFNPGLGSGGTGKTNVGGPSSSFGIWYESLPEVQRIVREFDLKVVRIHTHIGSGSDPAVWQKVSGMSLDLCTKFKDVSTLNLGGGYKVGRMSYEKSTELAVVGAPVKEAFERFAAETGRKLRLEIEPGTFLLANSCAVVCTVQDKVVTGTSEGHTFLKLDTGMTEVLRPSLYGSQHPLVSVKSDGSLPSATAKYVVVGHCCESGDLLTPAPDEPETISERALGEVEIGDLIVIEGAGAYCAGMSSKNYNSFPEAPETMKLENGTFTLIRAKQTLEQILANECDVA